jgi:heme/copper-type cytochrome/quinol oxidase subunit 1
MVFTGTVWYFLVCIQGPFQSLPSVQRVTHFTQWVVAHAHIALLGFAGFIAMGGVYYILPILGRRIYSRRLANMQFWLMLVGTTGIFLSLTFAGLLQGEAWRGGEVVYRVLPELKKYFLVRGISGMLLLAGALIFVFNVVMTVLARPPQTEPESEPRPSGSAQPAPAESESEPRPSGRCESQVKLAKSQTVRPASAGRSLPVRVRSRTETAARTAEAGRQPGRSSNGPWRRG